MPHPHPVPCGSTSLPGPKQSSIRRGFSDPAVLCSLPPMWTLVPLDQHESRTLVWVHDGFCFPRVGYKIEERAGLRPLGFKQGRPKARASV